MPLFTKLLTSSLNTKIQKINRLPPQRPVTRSFDVFFDLRLDKRLSKQWWGWWFETPSRSSWRPCNVLIILQLLGAEVYHYHTKLMMKEARTGGAHIWHQDYGWDFAKYREVSRDLVGHFNDVTRFLKVIRNHWLWAKGLEIWMSYTRLTFQSELCLPMTEPPLSTRASVGTVMIKFRPWMNMRPPFEGLILDVRKHNICSGNFHHFWTLRWDEVIAGGERNTFSEMKISEFRLKFHWNLFPGIQLKISQH